MLASARAARARDVMVLTFCCWSLRPLAMMSTMFLRCGRMAQPMRMAICWMTLMPVCLAYQLFLLLHTALRKGSRAGTPRAEATTANALAVVFLTNSS